MWCHDSQDQKSVESREGDKGKCDNKYRGLNPTDANANDMKA